METAQNFSTLESSLNITAETGRSMFGESLQISLFSKGDFENLLNLTLKELAEIELALTLDSSASEICRVLMVEGDDSFEMSRPVAEVLEKALDLSTLSDGYFEPFKEDSRNLDLRSLINGYVVDQTVKMLTARNPSLMGMVRFAEGIRFFNCPKKSIQVRMKSSGVNKEMGLFKDAISTIELQGERTVSVIADSCAHSNALTKIGLHAPKEIIQSCVGELKAQFVVFDASGEIEEIFEESKAYNFDRGHISRSSYGDNNRDS